VSFVILLKKFRAAKGALKNQLRLILFGIGTTFGLILLNNLLLVVIFNVTVFVPLGPAFTLIFTGAFAYAIIRHHLFDVRKFAARSMAYILSIGTMAAIYSAVIFGASYIFIKDNDSIADSRLFGTFIALLLAFSFQAIKKFFDRLSDSIFYKDVYDPQKFLDEFNQILVERVELDPLLEGSTSVIVENLKADFCTFVIRETAYFPIRTIGTNMPNFNDDEIVSIRSMVPHIRTKVIVTDLLNEADQELKDSLLKKNIAVVVRLVPTLDFEIEGIGEIMLGAKRNGEAYTVQDIQILEILGNELVIAIQNALRFEEIDKFNITLQNKIDVATKQLKRTNEKLQALDETKDEFISMASHQLRTPLTSVKGYLSRVLEGDAGELNEMQKKLLNQAFTSSQRMVYLIADLLNVSRLKTGKFIIERHPTNLAEVVEGEIAQLIETAKARDLELTFKKPESFTAIMLDEVKIRQVIMNFTDNAIYYTPAGGHIKVGLKETKDSIEFTVTDDGMGVPKSEQPHLFTKFYRAGNARKARPDGTGLGLFMAKKVIVAQGGALVFKSQEGKGSTFGFSFSKSKMKVPEITPTVAK
jgi:signal transduction histidine kinase